MIFDTCVLCGQSLWYHPILLILPTRCSYIKHKCVVVAVSSVHFLPSAQPKRRIIINKRWTGRQPQTMRMQIGFCCYFFIFFQVHSVCVCTPSFHFPLLIQWFHINMLFCFFYYKCDFLSSYKFILILKRKRNNSIFTIDENKTWK